MTGRFSDGLPFWGGVRAVLLLVALLWVSGARGAEVSVLTDLASVAEAKAAGDFEGRKLRVQGVVTCRLPSRRLFFLTDGTNALSVLATGFKRFPEIGERVEVVGAAARSDDFEALAEEIRLIAKAAELPSPREVGLDEFPKADAAWVAVSGYVVGVLPSRARSLVKLRQRGNYLTVGVTGLNQKTAAELRNAQVTMRGIVARLRSPADGGGSLWVDARSGMEVIKEAPVHPLKRAVKSLADVVRKADRRRLPDTLQRVRGVLEATAEGSGFQLRDHSASVAIRLPKKTVAGLGDVVDVAGFVDRSNSVPVLNNCLMRTLGLPATAVGQVRETNGIPDTFEHHVPEITRLAEIGDLADEAVRNQWPVRLWAGVSYVDRKGGGLFVTGREGGGVRLLMGEEPVPEFVEFGKSIEVRGHLQAGALAPVIRVTGLVVNSMTTNTFVFPEAETAGAPGFRLGRYQGQWVSQEGTVRRQESRDGKLHLTVVRKGGRFRATVELVAGEAVPDYLEATVKVTGVAAAAEDGKGLSDGAYILASALNQVEVLKRRSTDVGDEPMIAIGDLLESLAQTSNMRMRRVEGVVTALRPDRLFVEDESGAVEVWPAMGDREWAVGDRLAVLGYPEIGESGVVLEDARVSRLGSGTERSVAVTHAHRIPWGDYHGRLVSLSGRLVGGTTRRGSYRLLLSDGNFAFSALLGYSEVTPRVGQLEVGTRLRVTGVCEVRSERDGGVDSFRLLLRSEEDVVVLGAPMWWTPERTLLTIGGLSLVLIGSLAWASFLRRRVEQTQSRFATAFDATPLPVAIVTLEDFKFLSVNESFLKTFECRRQEVIGRTEGEVQLHFGEDQNRRFREQFTEAGAVRDFEGEVRTRGGKALKVFIFAERIVVDGDDCVLMLWRDVTERLNLMNQLRESQKMEAVGQLAAGVAHDFNNLLTIIRGNSQLMRTIVTEDSEESELNQEMDAAAARAAELTRQLLAFSRKQVMQKTTFDLNSVVNGSRRMLQRLLGETIEVRLNPHAESLPVRADAGMVDQIVMNLAVNARDAMPQGGILKLSTATFYLKEDGGGGHPQARSGSYAVLSVSDTGTGMDEETRKRIFEPFFTTKELGKGTGLGLSTVYGLIRQHQGWIEVESELEKGTTFTCFLPAASAEEMVPEESDNATAFLKGTETIMVVEDEPAVARMIRRTLTGEGYEVLPAENGLEARRVWRTERGRIDLLLTDVVMPGGVNGVSLAREFYRDSPELPVIFMSGYSDDQVRAEGDLPPGAEFIPKPFSRETLLTVIRESLEHRSDSLASI